MSSTHEVVGPVPTGKDPDAYDRLRRRVLWSMPSGLYVVGTRARDRRNLMTISWVTQVAMSPKLVGIGVESGAVTHELLVEGGVFALSLLPRSQRAVVRRFAKPVTDSTVDDATGAGEMQGQRVSSASTGAPILDVAVSWLDCEVRNTLALGSHSWFVGEIVDCGDRSAGSAGVAVADEPASDTSASDTSASGETASGETASDGAGDGVLRMEDTRMNYGG